jgi:ferritin-like protein
MGVLIIYDRITVFIHQPEISEKLAAFREDHKRHIEMLFELIHELDGVFVTENSDDFSPFFFNFTLELADTEDWLNVLLDNEKFINEKYIIILSWEIDSKTGEILDENLSDEQEHLRFITHVINDRIWDLGYE